MKTFPDDSPARRDGLVESGDDEPTVDELIEPELGSLFMVRPLDQIVRRGTVIRRRRATASAATAVATVLAVGSIGALSLRSPAAVSVSPGTSGIVAVTPDHSATSGIRGGIRRTSGGTTSGASASTQSTRTPTADTTDPTGTGSGSIPPDSTTPTNTYETPTPTRTPTKGS